MKRRYIVPIIVGVLILEPINLLAAVISESDVELAIESMGRDRVVGNILLWFLCIIAFLKVAQKIDSILASLGLNVVQTGGNMLAPMLLASKAVNMVKSIGGAYNSSSSSGSFNNNKTSSGLNPPLQGGLVGSIGRYISNSAVENVTKGDTSVGSQLAGKFFDSSLGNNGKFANDVVSKVAHGDFSRTGSIKGDTASSALSSYLGYNNESYSTKSTGSMYADTGENIVDTAPYNAADINTAQGTDLYQGTLDYSGKIGSESEYTIGTMPLSTESADTPAFSSDVIESKSANFSEQSTIATSNATSGMDNYTVNTTSVSQGGSTDINTVTEINPTSSVSPITPTQASSEYNLDSSPLIGDNSIMPQQLISQDTPQQAPEFSNVEIGGGVITGIEKSPEDKNGVKFGMYSANKFHEPNGSFSIVNAIDGSKWYKQYAEDTVKRHPHFKEDGNIGYTEEIHKILPPAPKRKDR